ncbi:11391_t:CDS:2 [Gigaspora rosea]|nr:11391_t:CDS:2 [Gigaspora rosea]
MDDPRMDALMAIPPPSHCPPPVGIIPSTPGNVPVSGIVDPV